MLTRPPRAAPFPASIVAFALVVAACAQTPATPADEADPTAALTMSILEPDTIDPQRSGGLWDYIVLMVFEPLLNYDPHTLRPVPAAALDLPALASDGLRYTFTLREGLSYSDGTRVLAKDFVYGWSRLCDPVVASTRSALVSVIVGCDSWRQLDPIKTDAAKLNVAKSRLLTEGIVARSDRVLEFNLTRRAPYFLSILAMWLGAPVRESDVSRGGETWTDPATYVGNGPYVLSEWRHGDRLVFKANPRFRTQPRVKNRVMRTYSVGTRADISAYRNGQTDVLPIDLSPDIDEVERDPALKRELVAPVSNCTDFLRFNVTRPPLDDSSVRLALAKSFDRDSFVRDIYIGTPALSMIPPGFPGHDPVDDSQAFDPHDAKRLFASLRHPASADVPIEFVVANQAALPIANWFREQWRANLGLDVTTRVVDLPTMRELQMRPETNPHVRYLEWCASNADQNGYLSRVAESSSGGPIAQGGYASAAFDGLVHRADVEMDAPARDALYIEASQLLSRDAPAAFVAYRAFRYLEKPWVHITHSPLDSWPGMFDLLSTYVTKHN